MNKYKLFVLMFLLPLFGCGVTLPPFEPLEGRLLKIIEIYPSQGEELGVDDRIWLKFSAKVDPESVNPSTIFVLKSNELPDDLTDLDDAELIPLEGQYMFSDAGDEVEYQPDGGFGQSGEYSVIVTNKVSSEDGIPLSSGDPERPFLSTFLVNLGGGSPSGGSSDGEGDYEGGGDGSVSEVEEEKPMPAGPTFLMINEILYDADGSDSNGDIFIELLGEPGGYLEGYYINLVNGADGKTYKTIPITEGHYIPDDGIFVIADTDSSGNTNVENPDFLVNFDPQNGPDSIQLVNRDNELLDVVGYGDVPTEIAQNGFVTYETVPAEDISGGMSLSRALDAPDSNNNSADFIVNETPTPGV